MFIGNAKRGEKLYFSIGMKMIGSFQSAYLPPGAPDRLYRIDDFWDQRMLGTAKGGISVPCNAPHDCKVTKSEDAAASVAAIDGLPPDARGSGARSMDLGRGEASIGGMVCRCKSRKLYMYVFRKEAVFVPRI
ncbi:hypothetical protein [Paenibacillus montanisoli]|uniref:Uncharacterized protein n=1 Tax=Paenibacillus montanisoli TaxID=2081970 RepID=A0A328TWX9_9BACL|nr:hypothetical protein [Paenibacillus montanisoli]RAP74978.1 hypothetical protein DL346_16405 [Paenibacillus montanisoli]